MAKRIRVILCEPGREPVVAYVENTLPGLQGLIGGGYLQQVPMPGISPGLNLLCDEEGAPGFKNLPPNRDVPGPGPIHGPFFFARGEGEDFISLTDDDMPQLLAFLRGCLTYVRL